jgi:TonB family protein
MLMHKVKPDYPAAAKKAHIEGTVVLHAIIGKDGTVERLEYVSGPTELADSAMDAVKKWRYKPMTLNDQPVEVDTEISVQFGKH